MSKSRKISQDQLDGAIEDAVELATGRVAALEAEQVSEVSGGVIDIASIIKTTTDPDVTTMGMFPSNTSQPDTIDLSDF